MAVSGETVVVGARLDDAADQDSGRVRVHALRHHLIPHAKLTASDATTADLLGISVAVAGD